MRSDCERRCIARYSEVPGACWSRGDLEEFRYACSRRTHRTGPAPFGLRVDAKGFDPYHVRIDLPYAHASCELANRGRARAEDVLPVRSHLTYSVAYVIRAGAPRILSHALHAGPARQCQRGRRHAATRSPDPTLLWFLTHTRLIHRHDRRGDQLSIPVGNVEADGLPQCRSGNRHCRLHYYDAVIRGCRWIPDYPDVTC